MRFQSLLILFPFAVGLFWFLAYVLFAPRNELSRKAARFMLVLSSFFLFASLSSDTGSRLMLHFTLFEQVCALALIPCFLSYQKELGGKVALGPFFKLCCMLPLVHLIVGIESVFSAGFENALRIMTQAYTLQGPMFASLVNQSEVVFYVCYTYAFGSFLLSCFMLFAVNMMSCAISGVCNIGDVAGFFFKGRKIPLGPVNYFLALIILLIIVPALLLGRRCYVDNFFITVAACFFLAFIESLIAFLGTAGKVNAQSIKGLLKGVRFGSGEPESNEQQSSAEDRDNTAVPEGTVSRYKGRSYQELDDMAEYRPVSGLEDFRESFDSEFEKFMLEKKMFLKRDLSLAAVADTLKVDKGELADYMAEVYGMSFMSYLNMLRVNYAEQYILDHDDVTQKDIADACGFSSASAFNTAFSKLTGVTPKIWKARYAEMSKRKNVP